MTDRPSTLTRADLADALYRLELIKKTSPHGDRLSRDECGALVEALLRHVAEALVAGETVKLSSFGAFSVREKAERMGRNPKTGEDAAITPRRVLSFRASNVMKEALNQTPPPAAAPDAPTAAESTPPPLRPTQSAPSVAPERRPKARQRA